MPIYEYACNECEHVFELIQRMGAPAPEACPECGEPSVRKLVSTTSFRLQGSGWYKDGYGSGGGPSKSSESTTSSEPSKSSEPGKSSESSKSSGSGGTLKPTAKEESTAKAAAK